MDGVGGGGVGIVVVGVAVLALVFNSLVFVVVLAHLLLYLMALTLGVVLALLVLALAMAHSRWYMCVSAHSLCMFVMVPSLTLLLSVVDVVVGVGGIAGGGLFIRSWWVFVGVVGWGRCCCYPSSRSCVGGRFTVGGDGGVAVAVAHITAS